MALHESLSSEPMNRQGLHDDLMHIEPFTTFDVNNSGLNAGNTPPASHSANSTTDGDAARNSEPIPEIPNPMVPVIPAYMRDGYGTLRYLGHSSTFSFSRQLLSMVHECPQLGDTRPSSVSCDAESYAVDASSILLTPSDFTGLPPFELATFYLQVLKFKINPFFHLFDEICFEKKMQLFYENSGAAAHADTTWYLHYLLIMAFGKALTSPTNYNGVVGMELFNRALRMLPDVTTLWRDLLTGVEIMCCVGLYLFSIDHRAAGYIYVSISSLAEISH